MCDRSTPGQDEINRLSRAAALGDTDALTELLCMHHARLHGLARRKIGVDWQGNIDPEDLLQETYAEISDHITGFTPQGEDAFFRWAARVLDHRFIDQIRWLRRKQRDISREMRGRANPSRYDSLLERCATEQATASRILRREVAVAAVMACLARLPQEHRELVERVHLRGESIAEVARDKGKSEDAVRRMVGRATDDLASMVGRASRFLSQA